MDDFDLCDEFSMDDRGDTFGFMQTDAPFPLPVDLGGTGAGNAAGARANLGLGTAATANIDTTLAVQGAAADAYITGDGLKKTLSLEVGGRVVQIQNGADLDAFTSPGNFRAINATIARSLSNCPVTEAFRLTVLMVTSNTTIFQEIITRTGRRFKRYSVGSGFLSWEEITSVLSPTSASTNRTTRISSILSTNKICNLSAGTFIIENLNMPQDTTIRGVGRGTVLQLPEGSTGYALKLAKGCTLENVKIVGTGGEGWIPDVESNDSDGILINVEGADEAGRNRINIANVEVCGFTGAGVKLESTGVNYDNSVNIVNCYIHNNYYGIDDPKNSEYNRIANCSIARNVVGIRMNGGNNLVTNCGINGNATGILMDATGISDASNDSHGTFSCCNINHSHTFTSSTTTTAIKIVGMGSGEVFSGCQVAYGGIEIQDSIGINFNACNFLSEAPITFSGTGFSMFSCCIFRNTSTSPVTKTGTGVLLFRECYVRTGAAFNPI